MVTTMKRVTDHWFERRAADCALFQEATGHLATCKSGNDLLEAQQQYASILAERVAADLAGLRGDMLSLGESVGSALGTVGLTGPQRVDVAKAAAE